MCVCVRVCASCMCVFMYRCALVSRRYTQQLHVREGLDAGVQHGLPVVLLRTSAMKRCKVHIHTYIHSLIGINITHLTVGEQFALAAAAVCTERNLAEVRVPDRTERYVAKKVALHIHTYSTYIHTYPSLQMFARHK